jgi:transcriptional regulator
MHVPPAFAETDAAKLFDFIEANSFGLVISTADGQPVGSHLPLLVERDVPPAGRLVGHMARANPAWRALDGQQVLCVFSGPHAYVSPTWYEAQDVVPTWNYVAVHVYGTCRLVEEEAEAARVLADYVSTYERSQGVPWTIDFNSSFASKLIKQIVAFRVEISRVEGKWKLGQNQPHERREKVARRLGESSDASAREIGRLMHETLRRR